MPVLEDILEWSANRPLWQRDALRRIITQESISDEDIEELLLLCLSQQGITETDHPPPIPQPLATDHLPSGGGSVGCTKLVSLKDLQGVNALADGQEMGFGGDGLTIIFGYNGSGKSGYARVLRSMCHARNTGGRILRNAYVADSQPVPSATIDYQVDETNHTETWQQGHNPPADLARVSFFDADCAAVHVDEANDLAYTPFGLDVLPRLASVCGQVSERIRERIQACENELPAALASPQAADGTDVRTMLNGLDEESSIESFQQTSILSEQETERISELKEILNTDPAVRAQDLRNAARRLTQLAQNIESMQSVFSREAVIDIQDKLETVVGARSASAVAAKDAFSTQPLDGLGTQAWQQLWEAARKFSRDVAYPGREYPVIEDGARCVLCLQSLGDDAKARLTTFESFVQAETQKAVDSLLGELNATLGNIRQVKAGLSAYKNILHDLPTDQSDLIGAVRKFCRCAWRIKRRIIESCHEEKWVSPMVLPDSPQYELEIYTVGLSQRAEELEHVAEANDRNEYRNEYKQLVARQWLAEEIAEVEAEISRQKVLSNLKRSFGSAGTTGLTRRSAELANTYVTDTLSDQLDQEINNLGIDYLDVGLDTLGGRLGHQRFKIILRKADDSMTVHDILSEGEFRAIALAGFLAELSTEETHSSLIFDDPVSSLDQRWLRKVARRLVELATERQVIIFTHDLVFLNRLIGFCEERRVPIRQYYLHRGPTHPGECLDGLPWTAMRVKARIGRLKDMLQTAEAIHRRDGEEAYELEAGRIYGLLREAWEGAVEEVLLNGVITRFDTDIHTRQLDKVSDISDEDIQKINEAITKASQFMAGHDVAGAIADPTPGPAELRDDIARLETWATEVRRRR